MYNLVYLIGRLTSDPEVIKKENGKEVSTVNLAVQRPYKNADGIYETDFIRCTLWDGIAKNTADYCRKGDLIAIRGQLKTAEYFDKKNEKKYSAEVLVDKVSFLASKDREKNDSKKKDDIEIDCN